MKNEKLYVSLAEKVPKLETSLQWEMLNWAEQNNSTRLLRRLLGREDLCKEIDEKLARSTQALVKRAWVEARERSGTELKSMLEGETRSSVLAAVAREIKTLEKEVAAILLNSSDKDTLRNLSLNTHLKVTDRAKAVGKLLRLVANTENQIYSSGREWSRSRDNLRPLENMASGLPEISLDIWERTLPRLGRLDYILITHLKLEELLTHSRQDATNTEVTGSTDQTRRETEPKNTYETRVQNLQRKLLEKTVKLNRNSTKNLLNTNSWTGAYLRELFTNLYGKQEGEFVREILNLDSNWSLWRKESERKLNLALKNGTETQLLRSVNESIENCETDAELILLLEMLENKNTTEYVKTRCIVLELVESSKTAGHFVNRYNNEIENLLEKNTEDRKHVEIKNLLVDEIVNGNLNATVSFLEKNLQREVLDQITDMRKLVAYNPGLLANIGSEVAEKLQLPTLLDLLQNKTGTSNTQVLEMVAAQLNKLPKDGLKQFDILSQNWLGSIEELVQTIEKLEQQENPD